LLQAKILIVEFGQERTNNRITNVRYKAATTIPIQQLADTFAVSFPMRKEWISTTTLYRTKFREFGSARRQMQKLQSSSAEAG
jgi:hypothetical protein